MPELTLGRGSRVLSALDSVREGFRHGMVRALLLSVAAAVFPVAGAFLIPERLADFGALLWLLPLIPAFLLAYYKGWKGVATSLACGMALLSITYAVAQALGRGVPDLVFPVVVFYIVIALMIGWLAERLQRDVKRERAADASLLDAATGLPNRRHAELHLEISSVWRSVAGRSRRCCCSWIVSRATTIDTARTPVRTCCGWWALRCGARRGA